MTDTDRHMRRLNGYVAIVGSINMDLVVTSPRWPKPGETLLGGSRANFFGGKGANQAVAASRAGAEVRMIGCVGDDADGTAALENLRKNGVDTQGCTRLKDSATGLAVITVSKGDNTIIVVPGANRRVSVDYVSRHLDILDGAAVVLMQLEIPIETVRFVLEYCSRNKIPVVLNPAPYHDSVQELQKTAAYITPNEHEASLMFPEAKSQEEMFRAAGSRLVMTLGKHGAAYMKEGEIKVVPEYPAEVVDTTGAGDTFNGVLAASLSRELSLDDAVKAANKAAGMSVSVHGAQEGMPYLEDIIKHKPDGASVSS